MERKQWFLCGSVAIVLSLVLSGCQHSTWTGNKYVTNDDGVDEDLKKEMVANANKDMHFGASCMPKDAGLPQGMCCCAKSGHVAYGAKVHHRDKKMRKTKDASCKDSDACGGSHTGFCGAKPETGALPIWARASRDFCQFDCPCCTEYDFNKVALTQNKVSSSSKDVAKPHIAQKWESDAAMLFDVANDTFHRDLMFHIKPVMEQGSDVVTLEAFWNKEFSKPSFANLQSIKATKNWDESELAIYLYTTESPNVYRKMNKMLREAKSMSDISADWQSYMWLLKKGLQTKAKYAAVDVYRGTTCDAAVDLNKGDWGVLPSFTSTSANQHVEVEKIIEKEVIIEQGPTPEEVAAMEKALRSQNEEVRLDAERKRAEIEQQRDLAEAERQKYVVEVDREEKAAMAEQQRRMQMQTQLQQMEQKMVVGKQVMEKAIEQEEELKRQQRELRKQKKVENKLKEKEDQQRLENLELETKCASQEEQVQLPSLGSAQHATGDCRRCNFFAKGRCRNGLDCSFCHLPHDRRKLSRQEKRDQQAARLQDGSGSAASDSDSASEAEYTVASKSGLLLSPVKARAAPPGLSLGEEEQASEFLLAPPPTPTTAAANSGAALPPGLQPPGLPAPAVLAAGLLCQARPAPPAAYFNFPWESANPGLLSTSPCSSTVSSSFLLSTTPTAAEAKVPGAVPKSAWKEMCTVATQTDDDFTCPYCEECGDNVSAMAVGCGCSPVKEEAAVATTPPASKRSRRRSKGPSDINTALA